LKAMLGDFVTNEYCFVNFPNEINTKNNVYTAVFEKRYSIT